MGSAKLLSTPTQCSFLSLMHGNDASRVPKTVTCLVFIAEAQGCLQGFADLITLESEHRRECSEQWTVDANCRVHLQVSAQDHDIEFQRSTCKILEEEPTTAAGMKEGEGEWRACKLVSSKLDNSITLDLILQPELRLLVSWWADTCVSTWLQHSQRKAIWSNGSRCRIVQTVN